MKKPIVINLAAGPGAGKSTTAAGVFFELKSRGINCELVNEYAKAKVWEESFHTLDDQLYVFAKQYHKQFILTDKVEVIITDAPIFLSHIYGAHLSDSFKNLVRETFAQFNNITYFIRRKKNYNPKGRMQTEDEAKEIDDITYNVLVSEKIPFIEIEGTPEAPKIIADQIIKLLGE